MNFLFDVDGVDDESDPQGEPDSKALAAKSLAAQPESSGRRVAKRSTESAASKKQGSSGKPGPRTADDAVSVRELTSQIKSSVERGFGGVWVRGEITDLARPRSGHVYFTLKDEHAQIRGVMWRSVAERLVFDLEDGQSLICFGDVEVYAARGSYQLIVRKCQPEGVGTLQLALAQLQAKLAAEGLFDDRRKRPLVRLPRRIAIVTSPSGAALNDFLQAAAMRHSGVEIVVIPAAVQGRGSAASIVAGIAAAHALRPLPDVLIVSRGGGSLEDLWSFNEEPVVRALAASRIPTVSAVGHEIDVTLADLVADVRALTPTDAASRVLPDRQSLVASLDQLHAMLRQTLFNRARRSRQHLDMIASRPVLTQPHRMIRDASRQLDDLDQRSQAGMAKRIRDARSTLRTLAASVDALSPLAVLARGYSVSESSDGKVLKSIESIATGDRIRTRLPDGTVDSVVEKVQRPPSP